MVFITIGSSLVAIATFLVVTKFVISTTLIVALPVVFVLFKLAVNGTLAANAGAIAAASTGALGMSAVSGISGATGLVTTAETSLIATQNIRKPRSISALKTKVGATNQFETTENQINTDDSDKTYCESYYKRPTTEECWF